MATPRSSVEGPEAAARDKLEESGAEIATSSAPRQPHEDHDGAEASMADKEAGGSNGLTATMSAATTSTKFVADTMPLAQEVLFVFVICLAQIFAQAGLGQVLPIISIIGGSFGVENPADLSWFMGGFSLTVGTFILFAGRLGDLFGYKSMFLTGLVWFAVWSFICGLAVYSNHVLFNFARVLQGIGPALSLPNGIALLGASYPAGRRKHFVFALFASAAPTGSILGSTFASLLALAWWPWAFWVFAIALAITTVLASYAIPHIPPHDAPASFGEKIKHLDIPGAVTGITGLVLFNFAWNQAPLVGWETPYVYVTLILAVLFLVGFFVIEVHYSEQPLIPFHVFSSDVSFVLAALSCGWACFGIWILYTYLYLREIRGASPLLSTAYVSPVVVSGFAAAMIVGSLLHVVGPPVVMTAALVAFTIGTTLIATTPVDQTYWAQIFVSAVITPFGMDASFPAGTIILSNAMPRKHQGIAASLVSTIVNYSTALGLGFAGTVEYRVNNGGKTMDDKLRGYRAALYMGIGLASLGVAICVVFLAKKARDNKRLSQERKEGGMDSA